jgi:hypothetical protein
MKLSTSRCPPGRAIRRSAMSQRVVVECPSSDLRGSHDHSVLAAGAVVVFAGSFAAVAAVSGSGLGAVDDAGDASADGGDAAEAAAVVAGGGAFGERRPSHSLAAAGATRWWGGCGGGRRRCSWPAVAYSAVRLRGWPQPQGHVVMASTPRRRGRWVEHGGLHERRDHLRFRWEIHQPSIHSSVRGASRGSTGWVVGWLCLWFSVLCRAVPVRALASDSLAFRIAIPMRFACGSHGLGHPFRTAIRIAIRMRFASESHASRIASSFTRGLDLRSTTLFPEVAVEFPASVFPVESTLPDERVVDLLRSHDLCDLSVAEKAVAAVTRGRAK